jgi:predicted AlkP superfamily pyrophosphatase or phosphodiesterase
MLLRVTVVVGLALCGPALAAAKPKLVVLLVIDQFRADYLERFRSGFGPGGFNRLLNRGAVFTNCNYDYAATETAPGHATLATGALPSAHGIINNEWFDRTRNARLALVEDPDHQVVGIPAAKNGGSPRNLLGGTIADQIRMAGEGRAQAVAVSLKERSAVLPAGKNPTAVFWIDQQYGGFATSTYYMKELPPWVAELNKKYNLKQFEGRPWRALGAKDTDPPLTTVGGPDRGFSPSPPTLVARDGSPESLEMLMALAHGALTAYKLGRGEATDFFSLSISQNDYVGHSVGPDHPLVRDIALRADRALAAFFARLDKEVGPGAWLVAFSADHGVAPLPEVMNTRSVESGRLRWQDVEKKLEDALRAAYGGNDQWVSYVDLPNIYLNYATLAARKVALDDAAHRAGRAAMELPGVLQYFTGPQLAAGGGHSQAARRVANSYFAGRSGDVVLLWKPFFQKALSHGKGSNHSSPYSYDTHVPLIFMGPGVKPGLYHAPVSTTDLAPTLAAILGINPPPVATGRALAEAMVTETGKRAANKRE